MKINQLKAGALLSYLQLAITVLVGLLYTPIMIRLLGQSEYGLYNTVSSTIAMLGILSLGLNSGYIRYYSRYKSSGDEQSVSVLNGTFMFVFCIIGALALVAGGVLTYNLDLVFKSGLTVEEYEIAEGIESAGPCGEALYRHGKKGFWRSVLRKRTEIII